PALPPPASLSLHDALPIYPKGAQSTGFAYAAANNAGHQMAAAVSGQSVGEISVTNESVSKIEKVFLFDLFNPWAKVLELGSTHRSEEHTSELQSHLKLVCR